MTQFAANGILLDIEGTTSSIRFVYDVMFPFARRELEAYLSNHWEEAACQEACTQIATEAGYDDLEAWTQQDVPHSEAMQSEEVGIELVRDEVVRLMDSDVKSTGLKQLQGLIWEAGFKSGELQAHLYDDVPPALLRWNADGRDVRIYSSGSIHAQKLFFGHTEYGNLLNHLKGHYDTTTGPKRDAESYRQIANQYDDIEPEDILFISDVVAELDAAKEAGMQTCLCIRPDNPQPPADHGHPTIVNFTTIELV